MFQNVFNQLYSIKFVIFVKFNPAQIIKRAAKVAPLYVNIFKIDVLGKKVNNKYL